MISTQLIAKLIIALMGLFDEEKNITWCVMTSLLSPDKVDMTPSNPMMYENGRKPEVCFPTGPSFPTVH